MSSNEELAKVMTDIVDRQSSLAKLLNEAMPDQNASGGFLQSVDVFKAHLNELTGRADAAEAELADLKSRAIVDTLSMEALTAMAKKECADSFKLLADMRTASTLRSDSQMSLDKGYMDLAAHTRELYDILVSWKGDGKEIPDEIMITDDMFAKSKWR